MASAGDLAVILYKLEPVEAARTETSRSAIPQERYT
jgi:hypothetical protein